MYPRPLRIGALIITTAASLVLALLFAAMPAGASSRSHAPSVVTKTLYGGMKIVPIVRILGSAAHKKGYFTVLAANGRMATVPNRFRAIVERRMKQDQLRPDSLSDRVYGNCGSSYITLGLKSSGYPIDMTTGFNLILPAVAYDWVGGISGPSYSYPYATSGNIPDENFWSGKHISASNEKHGTWSGAISQGSWAELDNGQFCYSGGPAVSGHL